MDGHTIRKEGSGEQECFTEVTSHEMGLEEQIGAHQAGKQNTKAKGLDRTSVCRCPWHINTYYRKRASWLNTLGKVELNSFITTEQPRVFGFGLVSAGMELSALNILGDTLPLNHTPHHAQSLQLPWCI